MMNGEYETALSLGVQVAYDARADDLDFDGARCAGVTITRPGQTHIVRAGAVVAACGGFEANIDWLKEYWGAAADNFVIRGTPYNQGRILRVLLDSGASPVGDPREFHAVAVDARAPRFDGGIVTRLDSTPFGIAVNRHGQRFYDEGEDFWPKRYAIWGGLIARQPDQIAYSIVDARVLDCVHALGVPAASPLRRWRAWPFSSSSIRRPCWTRWRASIGLSFRAATSTRRRSTIVALRACHPTSRTGRCRVFGRIAGREAARHVRS